MQQHVPDIEAVASGAIASDYQRLRVENVSAGCFLLFPRESLERQVTAVAAPVCAVQVCGRLGLVSLAYLWHQPQAALLDGMVSCGLEAVLVKVAALGLDPGRHLGQRIDAMRPHLHTLRRCV